MPGVSTIKSYLVSLGFEIKNQELRKFQMFLKEAETLAERSVGGLTSTFVKAGASILGTLTSVGLGTVGLMDHVAEADLGYQLFARRMFMATDQAKKLKIAQDALGYSLEEIVWGPPELAERYRALVKDQTVMMKELGGAGFEKQMRRIRDIRFEFTRMGVEAQYFAMSFTKSLSKTMFGDESSLLGKLQDFNEWFIKNIPRLADELATKLVPILRDVFAIWKDIWGILKQIDWRAIADGIVTVTHKLKEFADFVAAHPVLQKVLLGAAAGGAVAGPGGAAVGALAGGVVGVTDPLARQGLTNSKVSAGELFQYHLLAKVLAKKYGVNPAVFEGLIQRESSWNPNAVNKESGAMGFGQIMPGNQHMYGLDASDPNQNLEISAHYLGDLLKKYKGDWNAVLKEYGGFVTQDPSNYINDIMRNAGRYQQGGATYQPQAYKGGSPSVNVGGITVNVTQPNATAKEIAYAVRSEFEDQTGKATQRNIAQFQGAYA